MCGKSKESGSDERSWPTVAVISPFITGVPGSGVRYVAPVISAAVGP